MNKINELIKWCDDNNTRKEYMLIKAKLKMIDTLCEEIPSLKDNRFVEEIIDAFSEIIDIQQEIIDDIKLKYESYTPSSSLQNCYIGTNSAAINNNLSEEELQKIRNPYLPLETGFQTDKQLAKSFSNYLQYHNVKKLSKLTAYDYCSRIKNLWNTLIKDCKEIELNIVANNPMLNVYNNIDTVLRYVDTKFQSLEKGTSEFKNTANASAALNKFEEFKRLVERKK